MHGREIPALTILVHESWTAKFLATADAVGFAAAVTSQL
jgi:hypothetical protein